MDKLKEIWAKIVAWFTNAKAKVKEEADEIGDKLEAKKDELEEKWKREQEEDKVKDAVDAREEAADEKLAVAKENLEEVKDSEPTAVQIDLADLQVKEATQEHAQAREAKRVVRRRK